MKHSVLSESFNPDVGFPAQKLQESQEDAPVADLTLLLWFRQGHA